MAKNQRRYSVIRITIPYIPTAKGRPKFTRRGFAYTPKKTRDYEKYVKQIALRYKPKELLTGALEVRFYFYRPIPKSFSKKNRELALCGRLRPKIKPDLTNYTKAAEDALEGIIYKNDAQIVDEHLHKYYSATPKTIIVIEEVKG